MARRTRLQLQFKRGIGGTRRASKPTASDTKKARFTYTNPFATSRAYRVRSTHPWLVSFVPSELHLGPGRSANVGIVVDAKRRSAAWLVRNEAVDVLIFINDDDDKCVEAVRLRVHVD